jgi:hypothetical protein
MSEAPTMLLVSGNTKRSFAVTVYRKAEYNCAAGGLSEIEVTMGSID